MFGQCNGTVCEIRSKKKEPSLDFVIETIEMFAADLVVQSICTENHEDASTKRIGSNDFVNNSQ